MKYVTIDYETEAIQSRPNYPPNPVGVAIKIDKHKFMSHVVVNEATKCWLWQGLVTAKGYGRYGKGGKRAHRISYQLFVGEIPQDLFILHTCDNTGCVNPEHLKLGSAKENTADMMAKGRNKNGAKRGAEHYNYGKKLSEATREKLCAAWERRRAL